MAQVILQPVPGEFAVCRLPPGEPTPAWASGGTFSSVTRTVDELSVICAAERVPAGVKMDRGWELLKCVGPYDLSAVGILVSVAAPLAKAGISLLTVGSFDTDYLLIKSSRMNEAARVLEAAGHSVRYGQLPP